MKDRLLHPDIEMKHRVEVQIRFSDYDIFGHINNNSYLAFFDMGKTAFFHAATGRECVPSEMPVVIVNINVDFLAPSVVGEPLEVQTAVTHVGEKSYTLYQRVVNPLTQSVKAQCTSIMAGFDAATQGGTTLPEGLRRALLALI